MDNLYKVRTLKLASGERLPVLIDCTSGSPLFAPTIYSLTQLRGRSLAAKTIEQNLRHIMVLLIFLQQRGIDLDKRFGEGRLFDMAEIESLVNFCTSNFSKSFDIKFNQFAVGSTRNKLRKQSNIRSGRGPEIVSITFASNRVHAIAGYLSWLIKSYLLTLPANCELFNRLESIHQTVIRTLLARAPNGRGRNIVNARVGLAPEMVARLLNVTAKDAPENPWRSEFAKHRNELIFRWLYTSGLRRGELLNIKVSDIDFRKETVTIARRADALEDPRTEQPTVKTRDRVLPIPSDLCQLTHQYVTQIRRQFPDARKHEYLFVADRTGAPMSLSALNKCFVFLRTRIPDLPDELCPHILRHTWNDNFSDAMDRLKISEADEHKMRSFLMGWSETSESAVNYTRRHVRRKANEVSLMLQSKLINGSGAK